MLFSSFELFLAGPYPYTRQYRKARLKYHKALTKMGKIADPLDHSQRMDLASDS